MDIHTPNQVRSSCAAFTSCVARVDNEAAVEFAESIDINAINTFCFSADGLSTNVFNNDIAFDSIQSEAGFIFFAHALDFGSGFRRILHSARDGKGAWLTIRAGLVRIGQIDPNLSCSWLTTITCDDIVEYFDLGRDRDGLLPLALQLLTSIHEIGNNILAKGYANPGQFVAANLGLNEELAANIDGTSTNSACALVKTFVETFPLTFCDEYDLGGTQVCFYKKAQLVVSELFMRFYTSHPSWFSFSDIDQLTAFVDNVVVAMMRRYGVVVCIPELAERIANEEYLVKASEEEVAIRACALHGVELIVACLKTKALVVGQPINSQRVCNWLWGSLGKAPENRKFPRHLAPSTSFY